MPGQAPGAPTAAPADPAQVPQAPGGQPDYTKAWEEYYKKMGMSEFKCVLKELVRQNSGRVKQNHENW